MTSEKAPAVSDDQQDHESDLTAHATDEFPELRNPSVLALPVSITVSVGRSKLTVKEIVGLSPQSVVKLDSTLEDPTEIYVGDQLIARGELVELDEGGGLGVKLTEICNPDR